MCDCTRHAHSTPSMHRGAALDIETPQWVLDIIQARCGYQAVVVVWPRRVGKTYWQEQIEKEIPVEHNNEWSLWYAPGDTTHYQFIYSYPTLDEAEEAVKRLSARDPDLEDSYEIRRFVLGEWVTLFVAEWRLTVMLPEEADYDG